MDAAETVALHAALRGRPFGEICATLAEWLPESEVPLRAANLIGTWMESGIIVALG
jgi:hypothetical protein